MHRRTRQAGFALAAISLIGMAAMGSAALMISENGIEENAAIEESLARIRIHWAQMGHAAYVLSRYQQDGACRTSCNSGDTARVNKLFNLEKEVANADFNGPKPGGGGFQLRWDYPEISIFYAIDTNLSAADTGLSSDGRVTLRGLLPFSSARTPFLSDVLNRAPEVSLTLCAGLEDPGDACPVIVLNSNISGIVRIADFTVIR